MDSVSSQPSLSKSAQKKAARAIRLAELKLQRRAREKEAKKEKKRVRAELRAAGELDEEDEAEKARKHKRPRVQFGGRVVIDLGFDHLMSEKEVKSLCSQLAYAYSANRAASYPFSLLFTSLNGRVLQRLESLNEAGYKRWPKTEWWMESYERLWNSGAGATNDSVPQNGEPPITLSPSPQGSIVYLTADSEEELSELKADETYIIGGIVDRNRYKDLCRKKAEETNIRTARLPIGTYLTNLPTRKVLTVNQVFEILISWIETRDWGVALNAAIPKRRFSANGRRAKSEADLDDESDPEHDTREGEEDKGEMAVGQVGTQGNEVSEARAAGRKDPTPQKPA